ncbi:MAG: PCI domain-containing protein, partial [Candidatus Thorarchaeota archaeon]
PEDLRNFRFFITGTNGSISVGFLYVSMNFMYKLKFHLTIMYGLIGFLLIFINYMYTVIYFHLEISLNLIPFHVNLIHIFILAGLGGIIFIVFLKSTIFFKNDQKIIKSTVIDLGTKFHRLEVRDIAEKCYVNREKVQKIIQAMIEANEIYAIFSDKSEMIEFDQNKNIDQLDALMALYKNWEKKEYKKETG